MARKIDNKILLIFLVILIAIFFVGRMLKNNKTEKSFKTELVFIDTSTVTSILLYPIAENQEEIKFFEENGKWLVSKGEIISEAGNNSVEGLLDQVIGIKPKRLASRSKDKWEEFHVNDSLATRIKVIENGNKVTLDLMVGKFTYQQSQDPYGGRGNVIGTTFVRLRDDTEVYAVDGFLTMSVNREFNSWRNQLLTNIRKEDVTKFVFSYPADSGFVAMKMDSVWMINTTIADSLKMDEFLSSLAYMDHTEFVDGFKPLSSPDFELTIEGNNFSPVSIQAFGNSENGYIINSSINPGSYFSSGIEDVFADLFKNESFFLLGE